MQNTQASSISLVADGSCCLDPSGAPGTTLPRTVSDSLSLGLCQVGQNSFIMKLRGAAALEAVKSGSGTTLSMNTLSVPFNSCVVSNMPLNLFCASAALFLKLRVVQESSCLSGLQFTSRWTKGTGILLGSQSVVNRC